jgi:nucleolar protein 56
MKARIMTTFIGCFGADEKGNILHYIKFPKTPSLVADKIHASKLGKIQEEIDLEKKLRKKGFKDITKSDIGSVKGNLRNLAIEKKFVKNQTELNRFISKVNIELAKRGIKKAMGRDNLIIQVNGAIEELEKSINILVERLREWYGLHFPEMDRIVEKHENYAQIISKFGSRKNIEHPELSHFREKSMGADLKKLDVAIIQDFAKNILSLYALHKELSKYLDSLLSEVAPNTKEVAGPVLAAKLISISGGLEKLARMPSSTIQLLGAEKALFRHLHGKGRSPKHGVIIMHPYVQKAPIKHKGKIARLISSKLSIAAKMDFYSNTNKANELKKDLESRVKEVLRSKK